MSIQAIFDKQDLDFFPEVQQRIKEAGPFEANQMLNKALQVINALFTPVSEQTKEQLKNTNEYILGIFAYKGWI